MAKEKSKKITQTFYIKGMHCASCKKIIEERISDHQEVSYVNVNLKKQNVTISSNGEAFEARNLSSEFYDLGYVFSDEPVKNFDHKRIIFSIIFAIIVFVFLLQSEKLMIMSSVSADENSSIITFVILGIVASLSSCVALVGGIILSMTRSWSGGESSDKISRKIEPHIKFHVGRLFAYVLGGGLLGLLGGIITFNNPFFYAILISVVAVIMLFVGLQMIGVSWVSSIFGRMYSAFFGEMRIGESIKNKSPFAIGVSTFFLPCGFTLIAQAAALASGDMLIGIAIMGAFAIGTLPVLLGVSFGGAVLLNKKKYAELFHFIVGTIIIVFSLYTINGQLNVLGLPSFSDINFTQKNEDMSVKNDDIDQQELHIVADGFEYTIVGSHVLQAGIPTKMIIDNRGIAGCGAFMAARGLLDDWIELKPGINEVDLTPEKGTYKITCTMGMVPPVTVIFK